MPTVKITYAVKDDPFYRELKRRVNRYMSENELSAYAGPRMILKTITILSMFVGFAAAVYSGRFHGAALVALIVAMQFTQFLMTVGIAHDAAHNCYVRDRKWNRRIMYVFDLLGINSHYWIQNHVHAHHAAPNVPLLDSAIESFSLMRLHPKTERGPLSPYQHFYIIGIYSFATLFQSYLLEFISFRQNLVGFSTGDAHSRRRIAMIYVMKLFALTHGLILPLIFVQASAGLILTGFVLGHMACGLALGVIFQTTHLHEKTTYVDPDENGVIHNSYARHILETTADFSPRNPLVTWISGGLNIHVAHHLFPAISQIHLPALAAIVKETARDFGVPYHEYGLFDAIVSHLRTIKRLGNLPSYEPRQELRTA